MALKAQKSTSRTCLGLKAKSPQPEKSKPHNSRTLLLVQTKTLQRRWKTLLIVTNQIRALSSPMVGRNRPSPRCEYSAALEPGPRSAKLWACRSAEVLESRVSGLLGGPFDLVSRVSKLGYGGL